MSEQNRALIDQLRHEVDKLHDQVGNLESAILRMQSQRLAPTPQQPASAQSADAADVLVGLSPELTKCLEVYEKEGSIRVRTTKWVSKKDYGIISKYLRNIGFERVSRGKDSYWWRRK